MKMKLKLMSVLAAGLAAWGVPLNSPAAAVTVFEKTTAYHHIRVVDENGIRTLKFDDSWETEMSLTNPLTGHFEYTELFQTAWLWNTQITHVLVLGLGGASTQRSYEHYHPGVTVETAELDPVVLQVATNYFTLKPSPRQQVHIEDGRVFLRRSTARYDEIMMDAYVQGRYGSGIPQHLATREFFELVRDHLTTNGVAAYNVIGTLLGWRADIVGAMYKTMRSVFPQVYIFPAQTSQNVVLIATLDPAQANLQGLRRRALALVQSQQMKLPRFRDRVEQLWTRVPSNLENSPVLTDDYAPVESLVGGGGEAPANAVPAKKNPPPATGRQGR
jgi:spermidine synthase